MTAYSDRQRYEPRDGDRVQHRTSGTKGTVIKCRYRAPREGTYFRVRLVTGVWVWPEQVIAESEGPYLTTCIECAIGMRTKAPNGLGLCVNCAERDEDRRARQLVGSSTFARSRAAQRFQPASVTVNATNEQRERIDRGRVSPGDEPF